MVDVGGKAADFIFALDRDVGIQVSPGNLVDRTGDHAEVTDRARTGRQERHDEQGERHNNRNCHHQEGIGHEVSERSCVSQ